MGGGQGKKGQMVNKRQDERSRRDRQLSRQK